VSRGQFYDWEQHLVEEGYLLIGAIAYQEVLILTPFFIF
jgi:hypothetical protein